MTRSFIFTSTNQQQKQWKNIQKYGYLRLLGQTWENDEGSDIFKKKKCIRV